MRPEKGKESAATQAMLKMLPRYVRLIDQACSVKMAGYWPSSCLLVYGPKNKVAKTERSRLKFSHLDRTTLINKGFIIWLSGNFFLPDTGGSPKPGSQSQRRIWFILHCLISNREGLGTSLSIMGLATIDPHSHKV